MILAWVGIEYLIWRLGNIMILGHQMKYVNMNIYLYYGLLEVFKGIGRHYQTALMYGESEWRMRNGKKTYNCSL